ncbi:MAG: class I SAM-dependent rRNA methyltransferase [Gammaproteobacteria bacterium]
MSTPEPASQTTLPPLRLRRNEERRLRAGHVWVFSNEVDVNRTPLTAFEPGEAVEVQDYRGRPLGSGYVNPHSLICARLVSRDRRHPWSASLIAHRLNLALSLRERLFETPFYRLVYGESDGLPGLVVDRFGDVLVAQITTAGMERVKPDIVAAIDKALRPRAVLLRNDNPIRALEQLPQYVETALGEPPECVRLTELGVTFEAPLSQGQKTGWYFDQAANRARLGDFVKDKRVLDVFSYVGAWGIQAAVRGAAFVTCIDESQSALEYARRNADLNRVGGAVELCQGDGFELLGQLHARGERYDVVILDPPAFIKRKKDVRAGTRAYRRLNELAMRILAKDAIMVSCSCSYHLTQAQLVAQMQGAARHASRDMQILGFGGQGPDHPVHPAIAETAYLKAVFARLVA